MKHQSVEKPPRPCPLCYENNLESYRDGRDQSPKPSAFGSSRVEVFPGRILRCLTCCFGFSQLRPSDTELVEVYRNLNTRVYESETAGRLKTAAQEIKIVQRYVSKSGRLLDIGCASGLFLKCAMDANWEVGGIEPSEELARKASARLGPTAQVACATLQAAQFSPASFDVVTLWNVLEHVPDPVAFLRLAGSLLKSGGLLFANVPNLDSIQARLLGSTWPLLIPEHLNYFNRKSLRICGMKAGLNYVDLCQRSAAFSLEYILFRLQQHRAPGASIAYSLVSRLGLKNFILPVRLGEICGVWSR